MQKDASTVNLGYVVNRGWSFSRSTYVEEEDDWFAVKAHLELADHVAATDGSTHTIYFAISIGANILIGFGAADIKPTWLSLLLSLSVSEDLSVERAPYTGAAGGTTRLDQEEGSIVIIANQTIVDPFDVKYGKSLLFLLLLLLLPDPS